MRGILEGMNPRYTESRCSVCRSRHAGVVDVALIAGRTASSLARQYGLGKDSVQRHRKNCLPDRLAAVQAAHEVEALTAEQLLAEVQSVKLRAEALCERAEDESDLVCPGCGRKVPGGADVRQQAAALRELRSTVELLVKLSFAAADRPGRMLDEGRPDIDALILQQVRNEAGEDSSPGPLALEAGSDDDVVEAEVVG